MLDVPVADIAQYMDDEEHQLVWEIKIGGDLQQGVGGGSVEDLD